MGKERSAGSQTRSDMTPRPNPRCPHVRWPGVPHRTQSTNKKKRKKHISNATKKKGLVLDAVEITQQSPFSIFLFSQRPIFTHTGADGSASGCTSSLHHIRLPARAWSGRENKEPKPHPRNRPSPLSRLSESRQPANSPFMLFYFASFIFVVSVIANGIFCSSGHVIRRK
ncbi:uncharacterized protein BKA78DRAFT_177783 [Phyllosticta capitalensis]|uniref:Transmembrane protein n=1 Tax=Phyllosticta capitalensis TaxID=121624 RepID=A0ABR1YB43_9PEZI